MHVDRAVDQQLAQEQFHQLLSVYQRIGLAVGILDPVADFFDMTYAANFGFVQENRFIRSNFRYAQRRGEAKHAEQYFRNKLFTIASLPPHVFFEGQGDLLYRDGKYFCGWGKRTSKTAIPFLERILGTDIIPIAVHNPYFYHLDTCFAPLGQGKALVYPRAFSSHDQEIFKKTFQRIILTNERDNRILCCNLISHNGAIVIGKGISRDLRRTLETEGFEVFETPMGEFLKGGGSVKCLTLEFYTFQTSV